MARFRKGQWIRLTKDVSFNSAGNPSMWGIDLEKGAMGKVIQYYKPSNFVVPLAGRYEVSFPLGNCKNFVAVLFNSQIEKLPK